MPSGLRTSISIVLTTSVFRFVINFLLLSLPFQLNAQVWIKGYLRDLYSHQPIANGEVKSALTNTLTDSSGRFMIRVIENDIISAKKFGYRFDTIHFSFHNVDSILIMYLQPLGSIMKNVTVKTSYSAYQIDSMRRRMAFDEGRSKTTFISKQAHQGFGLVLNLDRLTKSNDKHLKKQREIYEKTERWAYIHYRFADSMVQSYTGLADDSLHVFMNRYTPSYEWLRSHPSKIEVVYYISDRLKAFRKEERH
jgi:hypothetical protein